MTDCSLAERRGGTGRQGSPAVSSLCPSSAAVVTNGDDTTCEEGHGVLLLNSSNSSSSSSSNSRSSNSRSRKFAFAACDDEASSLSPPPLSLIGPRLVAFLSSSLSLTILRLRGSSSVFTLPFQWLEQQQQQDIAAAAAAAADGDGNSSGTGDAGGPAVPSVQGPHQDQLSLPLCWEGDCLAASAAAAPAASRRRSSSKRCSSHVDKEEKDHLAPLPSAGHLSALKPNRTPAAATTAATASAASAAGHISCAASSAVVEGALMGGLVDAEGRYLPVHCERLLLLSSLGLIVNPIAAFYFGCIYSGSLCLCVFLTSILHWSKPRMGWRRQVDVCTARSVILAVTGIVVVSAPPRICAIYLWCLLVVLGLHALGWYFCKQQRHLEGTICHVGLHFVASAANLLFFSAA